MRIVLGVVFGGIVGVLLVVGVVLQREGRLTPSAMPTAKPVPVGPPPSVALKPSSVVTSELFLVARLRNSDEWEQLVLVENGVARVVNLPEDVDRAVFPVTDRRRVYAHREKRIVAFSFAGKEEETITDSTPLVEPRGLFAAPDGEFVAFFLDDRTSSNTELWAYDARKRAKHVAVERLDRTALDGPVFRADGSFLLRDREKIVAGSPKRTGVDILFALRGNGQKAPHSALRASRGKAGNRTDMLLNAGFARSPDGQRVAVVETAGRGDARVTRVVEYSVGVPPSPRVRFSLGRGMARILGWTARDELVLVSEEAPMSVQTNVRSRPTLWVLRGDQKLSHHLGSALSDVALSSDGASVGFLQDDAGRTVLAAYDLSRMTTRPIATLEQGAVSRVTASPQAAQAQRVLQFLRTEAGTGSTASAGPDADHAAVLQYVTENIRTLADAPPGEPAAPERVWALGTSHAYFVDYRVGSTLWRRLLEAQESAVGVVGARVTGVFAPVEGEWVLVQGVAVGDFTPRRVFEFEPEAQQWVEKPIAGGAQP